MCSSDLEEIWFGGIIDLGLLLQSFKDQRVWVEELGDLYDLSSCNNGGEREEEQRRNTKKLQDQDQLGSPHLEEEWFGGIVDLGLLLQSSKDQ